MHAVQKLDTTTEDCLCVVLANKANDIYAPWENGKSRTWLRDWISDRLFEATIWYAFHSAWTFPHRSVCLQSTTWAKQGIFRPRYLLSAELRQ